VTRALRRRPPPVVARQAVRAPAPSITEQASEEQQKRRLEDSFRLDGAASPELPAPQAGGVSSSAARDATSQARAPAAADAAAWPPAALRLPRWLVEAERRLEADLPTIGLTVLFMVALIGYERGVQVMARQLHARRLPRAAPFARRSCRGAGCARRSRIGSATGRGARVACAGLAYVARAQCSAQSFSRSNASTYNNPTLPLLPLNSRCWTMCLGTAPRAPWPVLSWACGWWVQGPGRCWVPHPSAADGQHVTPEFAHGTLGPRCSAPTRQPRRSPGLFWRRPVAAWWG
jgi:hypothetical protein